MIVASLEFPHVFYRDSWFDVVDISTDPCTVLRNKPVGVQVSLPPIRPGFQSEVPSSVYHTGCSDLYVTAGFLLGLR